MSAYAAFLSDLSHDAGDAQADEAGARRVFTRTLLLVGALITCVVAGAVLVPIGGAVIGVGQVGVEGRIKRVTHPTGGVISAIFVANGDHVRAGQPLIAFDNRVTESQASLASLSLSQMLAQRARLKAEQLRLGGIQFPDELLNSGDPMARQAIADERRMFSLRNAEQSAMRAQLSAKIVQQQKEIGGYEAQIKALEKQTSLIDEERRGVEELWSKGLVTLARKNALARSSVDIQSSIGSLQANIAQANARIAETREQIIQLSNARRAEAGSELGTLNTALNDQSLRSVAATDSRDRGIVRASYDGIVDKLSFSNISDVVRPAEPIMDIVPDKDKLVIEARISPADVEQVSRDQKARIRFSSINSTATPEVWGKVLHVAADRSISKDDNSAYFSVRVSIDRQSLASARGIRLRPGMPAEIFIQTGSRSLLSYLTKPIRDQIERGFRDN